MGVCECLGPGVKMFKGLVSVNIWGHRLKELWVGVYGCWEKEVKGLELPAMGILHTY